MGAKLSGIIFATSLAVGVVLRVFMLLFTVNPVSGFIEHEYLTSAVLMIIFMIVAAALIFVSAYCGKIKNPLGRYMPLIGAIVNIVLAVAIFYEVFISKLLEYAAGMQKLMHMATGTLSVLALLYMAVCYFTKTDYPKILSALPILFWITRVITAFSEFAALATVSDIIIETAAMCLCLFVFMDNSKLLVGISVKNKKVTRAVAAICGYTCLVSSLPRIICMIAKPSAFDYFANIPSFTTLAAAFFAVYVALSIKIEE